MTEVTRILNQIEQGDSAASEKLLPLVYNELRMLATAKMSSELPGQTLQPTGLVHEAYIRLVDTERASSWDSRGHFFAAAAEAMRRILVERARKKGRTKHGGVVAHVELDDNQWVTSVTPDQLLTIDESLERLAEEDPIAAEVVKLRYFGGMSGEEAAEVLGIHRSTAHRHWSYARAWIRADLASSESSIN